MFQSIRQVIRGGAPRRRPGIDHGNVKHVRADLRFRLAVVEYVHFGKSGRRVARQLEELKSLLGEQGLHHYLRTLDPDLRARFVERFRGVRRATETPGEPRPRRQSSSRSRAAQAALPDIESPDAVPDTDGSNVVPLATLPKTSRGREGDPSQRGDAEPKPGTKPSDAGE